MPNISEIIKQIQKDLHCPVCGESYQATELKLKGLFDQTLVIQTVCRNNHATLFIARMPKYIIYDAMTMAKKETGQAPISTNDILDLHNNLKKFNGNFQLLWK